MWTALEALLFPLEYKNVDMDVLTFSLAYFIQHVLGNAKLMIITLKKKDIDWLIEQTEVKPFYREQDEELSIPFFFYFK